MNRVFIGLDPRQVISYTVLSTSIVTRTAEPVLIGPISTMNTPCNRQGLTPFTWARFLVPWLCDFKGWALFLDADIMLRADVNDLFKLADEKHAVMVSKNKLKFEWASVMLFNCAHPDNLKLTPEFIENAEGLHQILWTEAVGELPGVWNHLVGYDAPCEDARLVHYTQGVPAWPETQDCEHAKEWQQEAQLAFSAQPWHMIMGNSVHAKPVYERLLRDGKIKGAAQ